MPPDLKPVRRTPEQIEQLVQAVESCALAPAEFDHHAHMTVALWYLAHLPATAAADAMRATIQRFAACQEQHQLYHETITLFWMRLLGHYLSMASPQEPLADTTYRAIVELGSMQPVFRHYSRERVFSEQARREWVAPDLLPLLFDAGM
jgi:hypothetical protein